jgi:hypothetical protein
MTEADRLQEAERRWASGDAQGAISIHFDICINGQNDRVRLQSALVLVERLKAVEHLDEFLQVCDAGVRCAQRMRDSLSEAYLLAKKAEGIAIVNGLSLVPARKKLRMAPGWFGFSLERDEAQYKELTQKINANETEIEGMLAKALTTAEQAGSHQTKAQVLLCTGQVHFNGYMTLKTEYLKGTAIVPRGLLRLLRPSRLDDFLHFTKDERAKMSACLNQCEASYLAAADAFQKDGDELGAGCAYFNLANDLRSAFRFWKAKKYLHLASTIAERHGDGNLLRSIGVLEKSIRMRNRDTPNYLAGERRETPK